MASGTRSLSEYNIDAYTNTWSVAFFLFLSLLTLVMPVAQKAPELEEVTCWCPLSFSRSQVEYTNAICKSALLASREGREYSHAVVDAPESKNPRTQGIKLPILLFLFAICLRLPHLLSSVLSHFTPCINMDQTLRSAEAADSMAPDDRRQFYTTLIRGISKQANGKSFTYLYMAMKVVTILVILTEIILIIQGPEERKEIKSQYPCEFPVREKDVKIHPVQCVIKDEIAFEKVGWTSESVPTMVLSTLVIIGVGNILSTGACLKVLLGLSSIKRWGLPKTASLNLVFLLHLVEANLGVGVANGLAEVAAVNSQSNALPADETFPVKE